MATLRRCYSCGALSRGACPHCSPRPANNTPRDYADEAKRRAILKQWVSTRGYVCPGWQPSRHEPHPSTDLTVHHHLPRAHGGTLEDGYSVLCRSENSRLGKGHHG